jgi:hypothetical protein
MQEYRTPADDIRDSLRVLEEISRRIEATRILTRTIKNFLWYFAAFWLLLYREPFDRAVHKLIGWPL